MFNKFNNFIESLNECIVVGKKIDVDERSENPTNYFVLFKNRDRGFYPTQSVVHVREKGMEIVYILDKESGWKEGMNEKGICIINSRVSKTKGHEREPKDQFKIIPFSEKKMKELKSEKEAIIFEILVGCEDLDSAVKMAKDKKLMGINLLTDGERLIELEVSEDFGIEQRIWNVYDTTLQCDPTLVRTNHGVLLPDTGYQEYPGSSERHSSEIRKLEAERYLLKKISNPAEIFTLLSQQPFGEDSEMNVFRSNELHKTGGQILLDPRQLKFTVNIHGDSLDKFEHTKSEVENPKITIEYLFKK